MSRDSMIFTQVFKTASYTQLYLQLLLGTDGAESGGEL